MYGITIARRLHSSNSSVSTESQSSKSPQCDKVTMFESRSKLSKTPNLSLPKILLQLARVDKPIGTLLLFMPCAWSLQMALYATLVQNNTILSSELMAKFGVSLALFAVGSWAMRSAGCVINDLWDSRIDRQVARTQTRPLAARLLTKGQAIGFLGGLLTVGLSVLLQFNVLTIQIGLLSILPVIVYPYMKRVTYWPQAVLGLTFNWGALLGFPALTGTFTPTISVPLYLAGFGWTLIYDTIYAHQDKVDDQRIGVFSTALRFGPSTKYWLTGFSSLTIGALNVAGFLNSQSTFYFASVNGFALPALFMMAWNTNYQDSIDCAKVFERKILIDAEQQLRVASRDRQQGKGIDINIA